MRSMMINMRKKPQKPPRLDITERIGIWEGYTLDNMVDFAEVHGFEPSQVHIETEWSEYDPSSLDLYVSGQRPKTDEEYKAELAAYRVKLDKYNKWYEDNKETIEEELRRREHDKYLLGRKDREKERVRLLAELKKLDEAEPSTEELLSRNHGLEVE